MKKRSFVLIIIVFMIMLFLSGCGIISKEDEGPVKVGLLLMSSPDDMYSEGYYGYYALKALEEKYGVEIAYNDNVSNEDNAGFLLNSYGKKEFDLVIAIGGMFNKPMLDVAPSYVETQFICVGGESSEDNVLSYTLPLDDIGYITGALSAGFNENNFNTIAYVQSEDGANYYEGFLKGVQDVDGQTPVREFLIKSDETYDDLLNRFKGNKIGLAGVMFYSPSLEKSLEDRNYSFAVLGGSSDGTKVPRIILNYDGFLEVIYRNFMDNKHDGKNIELSLEDDILSVFGLDLVDSTAGARVESKLPKGN